MIDSPSEKNQIQLLMGMLQRHWLLVVLAGICGGGLAYALGSMLPQRYTAYAQIALDPDVRVTAKDVESKGEVSEAEIETHVTIIGANDHMRRVHADLLRNPPAHTAAQRDPDAIPEPDELRYWMKAYQERKSRVITVTYTHDRPELAAAFANRIADLYVRADGERKINLKIKAYAAQQLDADQRTLPQRLPIVVPNCTPAVVATAILVCPVPRRHTDTSPRRHSSSFRTPQPRIFPSPRNIF